MLKNLPKSFTPQLIKSIMEMGHGEGLLICDGNYPHQSVNCRNESIYMSGYTVLEVLKDILYFFPLDGSVEYAAFVMESIKTNEIYAEYVKTIKAAGSDIMLSERFDFYKTAASSSAIIVTTDTLRGGNIYIKKGVVKEDDFLNIV